MKTNLLPFRPKSKYQKSLDNIKNIIAIVSGKWSWEINYSSNLACLAKKNWVGLLDLDIYGPSLPIALDLFEQPNDSREKLIPLENMYASYELIH